MKKLLFAVFIIIQMQVIAHPGGHGGAGQSFTHWTISDGRMIEGRFLHGSGDAIVLETAEGGLIRVSIAELSPQDRALAQERIRMVESINLKTASEEDGFAGVNIWMLLAAVIGALLLHAILSGIMPRYSNVRHKAVELARISVFTSFFLLISVACKKAGVTEPSPTPTPSPVIPKTRTGFLDSAFAPFKSEVTTSYDNTWYRVASSGMPSHNMMVGIIAWQQQVPIPQAYTGANSWSIPLQPEYAATPLSTKSNLMKGAVAIAVNGIPIFNALNNRGEDSYLIGELDNWGGHCGRADDYHYHAAPFHLGGSNPALPIAFGLDGFPVYGVKEPDGSGMATLDTCHGHTSVTGSYHYHGTTNYPYVIGAMKGKVSLDPATPAPENQILPQAFARGARPATSPLKGAVITDFRSTGTNAYSLTYRIGVKNGYVHYSWDAGGKFTYTLVDTSGASVTSSYQR